MPNAKPAQRSPRAKATRRSSPSKVLAGSALAQPKPKASSPSVSSKADVARTLSPAKSGHSRNFTVKIGPKALKTLAARRTKVASIMDALGATIEESERTGRSTKFIVEVDRLGRPRVLTGKEPSLKGDEVVTPEIPEDDDLDRALDAARARGRLLAAEILNGDDMLSADAFAALLGVTRVTVNAKRQRHEVLALEGAKRGFRFPAWQLDENGRPFDVFPRLFELLGDSPWTVYRFLVQQHAELDGDSAQDWLRRGRADEVVETAESVARGAFV